MTAILSGGSGTPVRESFDAWGLRRNLDGSPATTQCEPSSPAPPAQTTRGYTNQEMVDSACLVNLNARFYDPLIARMPQADTVVSDVYDLQSFNRYSYVDNGPLSATDPTGHLSTFGQSFDVYGGGCVDVCGLGTAAQEQVHAEVAHAKAEGTLGEDVQIVSITSGGGGFSVTLGGVKGIDPNTKTPATYQITSQNGVISNLVEESHSANPASFEGVNESIAGYRRVEDESTSNAVMSNRIQS